MQYLPSCAWYDENRDQLGPLSESPGAQAGQSAHAFGTILGREAWDQDDGHAVLGRNAR